MPGISKMEQDRRAVHNNMDMYIASTFNYYVSAKDSPVKFARGKICCK